MNQISEGAPSLRGKKILIAEDEFDIRQTIAEILLEEGVSVVPVKNGKLAFAELLKSDFDLVISDIRMPDGDGVALLREMRRLPAPPPLLFITGFADISTEEAVAKGARAILHKPFGLESLLGAVTDVLSSSFDAGIEHINKAI